MNNELDHVAVAVADTEEALKIWRDRLGFRVLFSEKVNNDSLRLTHLDLGNGTLQLVEPLDPNHPLKNKVKSEGTHLHHLCFRVSNLGEALKSLPDTGLVPGENEPHQGTQGKLALFLDKQSTGNILVELTGN